jgi:hypothetical protein
MKKLSLILAASLLVPVFSSSAYASADKPHNQKFKEVNMKGLERFTKTLPKPTGSLNFPSSNIAKVAKTDAATTKVQDFKCGLLSSNAWSSSDQYGAYSFSTADINKFTALYVNTECQPNAGGFFTDDKYYFTYYTKEDSEDYVKTYVVDTNTWRLDTTIDHEDDVYSVAYAMAYDPLDGVAYGSFYNGTEDSSYWGYMNLTSGEITFVKQLDDILIAVAANDQGEVYAINDNGDLVSVEKSTGAATVLKHITSYVTTNYQQAASISEDGKYLYWSLVTDSDGVATGLVTIDLSTYAASVEAFTNYEYIGALHCDAAAADEGAPADPSNLVLNFTDDNLTGTINFDVPAVDNLGAVITGDVTYIVYVDGEQYATGTTPAGQKATVSVTVANAGTHTIAVRLKNDKGVSGRIIAAKWIGIDRPNAVTNLALVKDNNSAKLSWTAPTAGAVGGFFDINRVTYTVTRNSDNKVVAEGLKATSYTDDLSSLTEPVYVSYTVTAYADNAAGASVTSNGYVFGPAFQVTAEKPVVFDFDTEACYNLFTVINANDDKTGQDGEWQWGSTSQCVGYVTGTLDGDDWLITPDIYLKADRQYIFSYDMQSYGGTYWPDKYAVYMGQGATVAAMKTQLVAPTVVYWEEYRTVKIVVTVASDGVYNFGFHALSEADGRFCMLDNIEIAESYNLKAPVAVSDLKVTAGDKGALSATVSFTTPTKAVDGSDITALTSVKVYRGADLVKEFANPAVGAALSYEDALTTDGYVNYRVVAATDKGEGVDAEEKAWIGLDAPVAPAAHMSFSGVNPVISWTAPQGRGQHGGYVNTEDLSYAVFNVVSQTILAQNLKTFTYTDTNFEYDGEGDQELFEYGVYAYNAAGQSDAGSTFFINGEKYQIPFIESVAGGTSDKLLLFKSENASSTSTSNGYDTWFIDSDYNADSQDSDKGSFMVMPSTPGVVATIQMGKIDMTNSKNAFLSFYVKRLAYENDYPETSPEDDTFDVYVGTPDYESTLVKSVRVVDLKGKYTQYTVPLTDYAGKDFIYLQFKLNSPGAYYPVQLDNVQVRNTYDVNLQVASIAAPASVDVTKDFTAKVVVKNDGVKAVSDYLVKVLAGKDVVAEKTISTSLAAAATDTVAVNLTALSSWEAKQTLVATVTVSNDECSTDNSASTSISVIRPAVNVVNDLSVTNTETAATFTWTAPKVDTVQHEVEDFESYVHGKMTTGDVGDWTLIDNDGVSWLGDVAYVVNVPGMYSVRSFQVFNQQGTATTSTWVEDDAAWAPHSGNQMMIALANESNSNDDWLVSPKLSGKAQTITFWAKGYKGKERICVYYSTTSATVAALEDNDLGDSFRLSTEWTKYTFNLPEGSLYFAIQYQGGSNSYAALIDDVEFDKEATYNVTPVVEGYNLYCDGNKVNDAVITDTTYTVNQYALGTYVVKTVYNVGESEASNAVVISSTGVADISVDTDTDAPTYDLYGRRVTNLQPGHIYIRKNQKFVFRK